MNVHVSFAISRHARSLRTQGIKVTPHDRIAEALLLFSMVASIVALFAFPFHDVAALRLLGLAVCLFPTMYFMGIDAGLRINLTVACIAHVLAAGLYIWAGFDFGKAPDDAQPPPHVLNEAEKAYALAFERYVSARNAHYVEGSPKLKKLRGKAYAKAMLDWVSVFEEDWQKEYEHTAVPSSFVGADQVLRKAYKQEIEALREMAVAARTNNTDHVNHANAALDDSGKQFRDAADQVRRVVYGAAAEQ